MIMTTQTRRRRSGDDDDDDDDDDDTNNDVFVASVVATLGGVRSGIQMPSAARDFK